MLPVLILNLNDHHQGKYMRLVYNLWSYFVAPLAWNSLYSSGWPQIQRDWSTSASPMLRLKDAAHLTLSVG